MKANPGTEKLLSLRYLNKLPKPNECQRTCKSCKSTGTDNTNAYAKMYERFVLPDAGRRRDRKNTRVLSR